VHFNAVRDPWPFPADSLDAVTTFDSMEHCHDSPKRLFGDIARSLEPGGWLVIGVPNAANLEKRIEALIGVTEWSSMDEWYEKDSFGGHVREPTVRDLRYIAVGYLHDGTEAVRGVLRESLIVRGRSVDRRHFPIVEPQIHRQLPAMVRQVVDRVAQDHMARLIEDDLPAGTQPPVGRHQVLVRRLSKGLPRPGDVLVVDLDELVDRRLLILPLPGRWRQIQLVLIDDERHPRRHRRDEPRQPRERHRFVVRLPVITSRRHLFERAPRARRLAIQLLEK